MKLMHRYRTWMQDTAGPTASVLPLPQSLAASLLTFWKNFRRLVSGAPLSPVRHLP